MTISFPVHQNDEISG